MTVILFVKSLGLKKVLNCAISSCDSLRTFFTARIRQLLFRESRKQSGGSAREANGRKKIREIGVCINYRRFRGSQVESETLITTTLCRTETSRTRRRRGQWTAAAIHGLFSTQKFRQASSPPPSSPPSVSHLCCFFFRFLLFFLHHHHLYYLLLHSCRRRCFLFLLGEDVRFNTEQSIKKSSSSNATGLRHARSGGEDSTPRYKKSKCRRADVQLIVHTPYAQHEAPPARVRGKMEPSFRAALHPPSCLVSRSDLARAPVTPFLSVAFASFQAVFHFFALFSFNSQINCGIVKARCSRQLEKNYEVAS